MLKRGGALPKLNGRLQTPHRGVQAAAFNEKNQRRRLHVKPNRAPRRGSTAPWFWARSVRTAPTGSPAESRAAPPPRRGILRDKRLEGRDEGRHDGTREPSWWRTREGADNQVVARLSDLGLALLKEVTRHWGLTYAGLFEMLLRLEAERLGILVRGKIVQKTQAPADGPEPSAQMPSAPSPAASGLSGPAETAMYGLPDALSGLPVVLPDAPRQSLVASLKDDDAPIESDDF